MRKVRTEDALGLELCHNVTAMRDVFKGAAFRRGHVITQEDIPELLKLGKTHVFIWEPESGEIHEEDAARRLAELCRTDWTHFSGPSEGKIVMMADIRGLFVVDTELLRAVNSIKDVTISTLPNHYPVSENTRIASMRIIPLVTQEANIIEAERLCAGKKLISVLPYKPMTPKCLAAQSIRT